MGDKSKIEWTEATWNPTVGCTHVSPGCDNCYAASLASGRLSRTPTYAGLAEGGKFNGTVRLLDDRLDQPLRWHRPRRVFVNSMSDLFHDAIPEEFIAAVFARMWWSPRHTFQILTKRHARMRSLVPRIEERLREMERDLALVDAPTPLHWPLPNVWLGVSVENQQWADIRVPALLDTPAAVHFLSCEPLLGPVTLEPNWLAPSVACSRTAIELGKETTSSAAFAEIARAATRKLAHDTGQPAPGYVDWVIAGGESGPRARPMHPDWARFLRDQCAAAGVPFFFKQAGERLAREWGCSDRKGHDPAEWPEPFPREYPHA